MILSGHQPCYLPSLQLFAKMAKSDIFMHCGHLQFQHRSWHHRNYIWLNGKRHMLSVPVQRPHIKPIRDAYFVVAQKWKYDHLDTIAQAYGKSPFFDDYFPTLKEIIFYHENSLERLNVELTEQIALWLGITKTALCDSAAWHFEGDAVDMIIKMCKALHADTYLNNMGATNYIGSVQEDRMRDAGIKPAWLDFEDPDDEPLSAIHHLFTLGPEARRLIR